MTHPFFVHELSMIVGYSRYTTFTLGWSPFFGCLDPWGWPILKWMMLWGKAPFSGNLHISLVGGLEHPNWLIFFRGVQTTNQISWFDDLGPYGLETPQLLLGFPLLFPSKIKVVFAIRHVSFADFPQIADCQGNRGNSGTVAVPTTWGMPGSGLGAKSCPDDDVRVSINGGTPKWMVYNGKSF